MEVKTIKTPWGVGNMKQNTHVVVGDKTCVVIDAGSSLELIKSKIKQPIEAVFITHGHFDHVEYIEEYDKLDVPIYASPEIIQFLQDANLNVSGNKTYKVKNIVPVLDNETIECCVGKVTCIATPGHSDDSMCYLVDDNKAKALFSGDTLFSVTVGRIDLPTGDAEKLIESLEKISNFDYDVMLTGHGRDSRKSEQEKNIPKWINYLENEKHYKMN